MTISPAEALQHVIELEARRPFGELIISSNHTLGPVSQGLHQAADNLLHKAVRAIRAGDEARAGTFVERALQLPFDDHEKMSPAWWSASLMLFCAITDRLEVSEDDDDAWLTAAEQALTQCDSLALPALLGALTAIVGDYSLSVGEARRCRKLVGTTSADEWNDNEPADREQRLSAILAVLHCVIDYENHVDELVS